MTTTNRKKIKSGSKKTATDEAAAAASKAKASDASSSDDSSNSSGSGMTQPQMFAVLFLAIECATLLNTGRAARDGIESKYCTKIFRFPDEDWKCTAADAYLMVESYHAAFLRVIMLSCFVRICWSDDRLLRRLNLCIAAIPLAVSAAVVAFVASPQLWDGYTRLSLGIRWMLLFFGAIAFSWNDEVAQSKFLSYRLQNLGSLLFSSRDSAGTFVVLLAHIGQLIYYATKRGVQNHDESTSYQFDDAFSPGSLVLWYLTMVDKLVLVVLPIFGFLFFGGGGKRVMMVPLCIVTLFTFAYHLPRQGEQLQDNVISVTRMSAIVTTALQIGVMLFS